MASCGWRIQPLDIAASTTQLAGSSFNSGGRGVAFGSIIEPELLARATSPMTLRHDQIRATEWVAADAVSSSGLQRRRCDAPKNVHSVSDRLKVINASTPIVSADVVQLNTLRQWPTEQQPNPHVGSASLAIQHGLRVATGSAREPTCGDVARTIEVNLRQQPFGQSRVAGRRHSPRIPLSFPRILCGRHTAAR